LNRHWLISFAAVTALLVGVLGSSLWFNHTYVGWLVDAVPDANLYLRDWQSAIDELESLEHPAIVHYLPEGCLCRMLALKHAEQITGEAEANGFNVFQLASNSLNLGVSKELPTHYDLVPAPSIIITREDGKIAYVGAYSDGVRCNTGNSMVTTFIQSPSNLPSQPVVGLNVETCRCL
jgi:hypothetical protein